MPNNPVPAAKTLPTVGQTYKCVGDFRRNKIHRTLKVQRVGTPNPVWAGKRDINKVYAECISYRTGFRPRKAVLLAERLLTKDYELVPEARAVAS